MILSSAFKNFLFNFVKKGRVDKESLQQALENLKETLVEADVSYEVIQKLIESLKSDLENINIPPGFSGINYLYYLLYEKLKNFLASSQNISEKGIILVAGLQGSGKTTFVGKLTNFFAKKGLKVLVVSLDYRRPAAFEQLKNFIEKNLKKDFLKNIDFSFVENKNNLSDFLDLIKQKKAEYDIILVDTAGRSSVDKDLLDELEYIQKTLSPEETLFVLDTLMGQEALNLSRAFKEKIKITGIVLTKADSDTKGGAILSAKYVLEAPIYFVSEGESIDSLRPFNSEVWTKRILEGIDIEKSLKEIFKLNPNYLFTLYNKLLEGDYTLYDFKDELTLRLSIDPNLVSHYLELPIFQITKKFDEEKIKKWIAIINSMTDQERKNHILFKTRSRVLRVAKGSAANENEVKELIKVFAKLKIQAQRHKKMLEKEEKKRKKQMKNFFKRLSRW